MRALPLLALSALAFPALLAGAALSGQAHAAGRQEPSAGAVAGTPAAGAAQASAGPTSQVRADGTPIALEIGRGTLIRLSRPAGTVFVANPDVADVQVKSPSLVYINAKGVGETVIYAVDDNDQVLLNAPVTVQPDMSRLRSSLKQLMPDEPINVTSVNGALVLSGNVSTALNAESARTIAAALSVDGKGGNLINRLAVTTPNQVSLRVKIAEVNRTVLKTLGINWAKTTGGGTTLATQNPVTIPNNSIENSITFGALFPHANGARLFTTIDALAQEGLVTTLAQPNLMAMSGQTASFLAGGEFPVPVAVSNSATGGAPTITVEFKKFGVSLDFTPTILDSNRVNLRIRPEVSQISSTGSVQLNGFNIPGLTVRRAETSVELGSGESFAIGGLLSNNSEQDVSKVPGLGDIPIIGQLFRSDRFQRNETELVIIVTPILVRPTETAGLAAPTDGYRPPHDGQRLLTGDTYRQTLPAPSRGPMGAGGKGLIGSVGFRID